MRTDHGVCASMWSPLVIVRAVGRPGQSRPPALRQDHRPGDPTRGRMISVASVTQA